MKASGVVCCVCLGLCCSPLYGQHLPKLAARVPEVESQPAAVLDPQLYTASISAVLNLPSSATPNPPSPDFELERSPVAPSLSMAGTMEEATHVPSPEIACTELWAVKVNPAVESSNVFDHLDFSATAIKSAFTHDNLVKMGRNFVPGSPLPDAPSYVPLTSRQKFDLFLQRSHSVGILSDVLSDSIYSQATGAFPSFGGGMEGYGRRFGASVAGSEAGAFFSGFLFPTLLHQDPRYFPSHQYDISQRLAYAASRVVIGRSDSGRSVFNSSLILSQFVESALSNAYIPYRNETIPGTIENALANLGGAAEWNILTEFWPDIKSFFSRHQPKLLHQGQKKPDLDNSNQIASK